MGLNPTITVRGLKLVTVHGTSADAGAAVATPATASPSVVRAAVRRDFIKSPVSGRNSSRSWLSQRHFPPVLSHSSMASFLREVSPHWVEGLPHQDDGTGSS